MQDLVVATNVGIFATGAEDTVTFDLANLTKTEREVFLAILAKTAILVTAINVAD